MLATAAVRGGHGCCRVAGRPCRELRRHPRRHGEEFQVIRLRGFVRVFKCEDDADYHVEVAGSRTPKAKRVTVEVPSSQTAVRAQLEQLLGVRQEAARRSRVETMHYC